MNQQLASCLQTHLPADDGGGGILKPINTHLRGALWSNGVHGQRSNKLLRHTFCLQSCSLTVPHWPLCKTSSRPASVLAGLGLTRRTEAAVCMATGRHSSRRTSAADAGAARNFATHWRQALAQEAGRQAPAQLALPCTAREQQAQKIC